MRSLTLSLLSVSALLAGCASSPTEDAQGSPPEAITAAVQDAVWSWGNATRMTLVHIDADTTEFDVLCLMGGGIELYREAGRVIAGTSHLEVTVETDPTVTGQQVGWQLDGGDVTWLDVVRGGPETQRIEVSGAFEPAHTWAFWQQKNLPEPLDMPCYTGFGDGRWAITIEAVRA